jgi:cytoskeleton protein RodZ
MKSPGTMLQEAREEAGLSLSDVAAMTRIPKTMLGHLENDRFEEYVAEVFVRGHLRNYAREVHLDPETILQAYEKHTGRRRRDPLAEAKKSGVLGRSAPRPVPTTMVPAGEGAAVAVRRKSPSPLSGVRPSHLVGAFLILCGLFVMLSFLSSNRATAQDPTTFPVADESAWELEQEVRETRWLLEQSDRE